MIYLDTHVAAWLYAGKIKIFPANVRDEIAQEELVISPMVILELQYLFEIGRVAEDASVVILDLFERIGLKVCTRPFGKVVEYAVTQTWTRDPFDRIIVAQAGVQSDRLITKDELIHDNYPYEVRTDCIVIFTPSSFRSRTSKHRSRGISLDERGAVSELFTILKPSGFSFCLLDRIMLILIWISSNRSCIQVF